MSSDGVPSLQSGVPWCCAVCGDSVLARNYGALTCKSCKPFFRRNAKHDGKFFCKYGGNCKITIKTRKKCQKCRLDKCFAVGMRKELLMDEVDKHFRRSLIMAKRKKEEDTQLPIIEQAHHLDNSVPVITFSRSSSSSMEPANCNQIRSTRSSNEILIDLTIEKSPDHSKPDQDLRHQIRPNFYRERMSKSDHIDTMEAVISSGDLLHQSLNIYRSTMDFVDHVISVPNSISNYKLGFNELNKLKELYHIFKPIDIKVVDKECPMIEITSVKELVITINTKYEKYIQNFNKTISSIDVMENICQNDRIALIKYSCFDIQILRSVGHLFDRDREAWIITNGDKHYLLKLEFVKGLVRKASITYKHYINQLSDIISECDSVILYLLTAICLFNPKRPTIVEKEQIEFQHRVYLNLLHKYLQFKYSSKSKSESMFAKLLNSIIYSHILSEWEKKYFVEHYSDGYSQAVKDMLDID